MDGDFAAWFFSQVSTTFPEADLLWCAAAKSFLPNKRSCALVPVVSIDDNARSFGKKPRVYAEKGFSDQDIEMMNNTTSIKKWYDHSKSYIKLIGGKLYIRQIRERCRVFLEVPRNDPAKEKTIHAKCE